MGGGWGGNPGNLGTESTPSQAFNHSVMLPPSCFSEAISGYGAPNVISSHHSPSAVLSDASSGLYHDFSLPSSFGQVLLSQVPEAAMSRKLLLPVSVEVGAGEEACASYSCLCVQGLGSVLHRAGTSDHLGIFKCGCPLNVHINTHFRLILQPGSSLLEGISQVLVDSTDGSLSPKLHLLET